MNDQISKAKTSTNCELFLGKTSSTRDKVSRLLLHYLYDREIFKNLVMYTTNHQFDDLPHTSVNSQVSPKDYILESSDESI